MRNMKEVDLAMLINNQTMTDYLNRLRLLATSLFTWKNLDKYCGFGASRFLEQSLYDFGRACFIQDDTLGFMVTNANPSDTLNTYNLPTRITAWSVTYNKTFNFDDVVYILNNALEIPTFITLQLMATRLYETEITIDVNIVAQKTPVLIEGDTKTILTLKNVYMQYSGNTPFIFGNKQFDISNKLNVLKTDAPYLVDKLESHKHELWNEALTFLGINNTNQDKKERLITDEVNANNDAINYYLNCFYKTRKDACDRINEKYGLDIEIEMNKSVLDLLKLNDSSIMNYSEDESVGDLNG